MFNEVFAVMEKYRPLFREKYKTGIHEDKFAYRDIKPDPPGFGLIMWIDKDKDGFQKRYENLVIDRPEYIMQIMMGRIKETMKGIMNTVPKEEAIKMIEKGLGAKPLIIDSEHFEDIINGCPVHGKECPVLKKEPNIPVA